MNLALPTGRPGVLNRSYKINVRFAPSIPVFITIKHPMEISHFLPTNFGSATLFEIAARLEVPPLPRNLFPPAPIVTEREFAYVRTEIAEPKNEERKKPKKTRNNSAPDFLF